MNDFILGWAGDWHKRFREWRDVYRIKKGFNRFRWERRNYIDRDFYLYLAKICLDKRKEFISFNDFDPGLPKSEFDERWALIRKHAENNINVLLADFKQIAPHFCAQIRIEDIYNIVGGRNEIYDKMIQCIEELKKD